MSALTFYEGHTETAQALALGKRHGWDFVALGQAPLPGTALHLGHWLVVPAEEDSSPLPERTLTRIQALYAAGLRPKGFVVVHEAPRLLPASIAEQSPANLTISTQSPAQRQLRKLLHYLPLALGVGVLAIIGATLLAVVLALGSAFVVIGLFAGLVYAIDPILIAVMDDDTWLEIDRWWVEE